jgi:hypothetical protein
LRIEYKDATLAATKLPKNKPQNKLPEDKASGVILRHNLGWAEAGPELTQARNFEAASNHHAGAGVSRSSSSVLAGDLFSESDKTGTR